jgi:hypothetical protein
MKIYIVNTNWQNTTKTTNRAFHGEKEMLSAIEEKYQQANQDCQIKCKIEKPTQFLGYTIESVKITITNPKNIQWSTTLNYDTVELE